MTGNSNGGAGRSTLRRFADESQAPIPTIKGGTAGSVSKREKYEWATPGAPGRFMWIHKTMLAIDEDYQRAAVSQSKVLEIARNWDWKLCGVVLVARRPDGTFAVFEGGHRTRAAANRDDITELPCMVFDVLSVRDEAKAFVGANTLRASMSSIARHRGARVAGDPTATIAADLLHRNGYNVEQNAYRDFTLKCIGTVENMVAKDPARAEKVVALASEIAAGEPLQAIVLRALFTASGKWPSVFSPANQKKLIDAGQEGLVKLIKRYKLGNDKGGNVVEANAVKDFINKGRRVSKIGVDEGAA